MDKIFIGAYTYKLGTGTLTFGTRFHHICTILYQVHSSGTMVPLPCRPLSKSIPCRIKVLPKVYIMNCFKRTLQNVLSHDTLPHNFHINCSALSHIIRKWRGRRKHLKPGGTTLRGHFFRKKNWAFSENNNALLCLMQNVGSTCPQRPRFLRLWKKDFMLHNFYCKGTSC